MYKLILCEDDYQIRHGLERFFPWKQVGFELCACFENGRQALEYLRYTSVDVVLTDIRMPVMDGLELAHAINEEKIDACVVILSAYRDFEYARQAMQLGLRHYMVKSTKFDELLSVFEGLRDELDLRTADRGACAPAPSAHGDKTMEKLYQYIHDHIATASLQNAATYISYSPVYLSRFFKEKTGMNFIDYLIQCKMELAAQMLGERGFSIVSTSEIVGYSNEKNFARAFKKYHDVSPGEYQRIADAKASQTAEHIQRVKPPFHGKNARDSADCAYPRARTGVDPNHDPSI